MPEKEKELEKEFGIETDGTEKDRKKGRERRKKDEKRRKKTKKDKKETNTLSWPKPLIVMTNNGTVFRFDSNVMTAK